MQFDVVIGNPPYNDGATRQTPLHCEFVTSTVEGLKPKYLTFVTPCRWYIENDKYNRGMRGALFNGGLEELHDYEKCNQVFDGISLIGGVCYFLHNKDYHGETRVVLHHDKETEFKRLLTENKPFYRYSMMCDIIEKVSSVTKVFMSDYVLKTGPFGFDRNYKGSIIEHDTDNIKLISKNDGESWVSIDDITKNRDKVAYYKVCTNYDGGRSSDVVLGNIRILNPNEVCTLTYLVLAWFSSQENAESCAKYFKTKFVRSLIMPTHLKLGFTPDNFNTVPLQNFTSTSDIDWSQSIPDIDQQLYKKYNLTSEEIAYIESTINPME